MKTVATIFPYQKLAPALLALLLLLPWQVSAHPHPDDDQFTRVVAASKPAVVYIQVRRTVKDENPYKDDPELQEFFKDELKRDFFFKNKTSLNYGSGFIFNSEGYILTNSHVVAEAKTITVTLSDKRKLKGTLIGNDTKTDIGLIKVQGRNLPYIPLGNSEELKTGQWVLAIGAPYEYLQSVTAGIVSATGRNTLGISDYENFIQTDAAINPGNSGGPLLNTRGEAIGINTAFQTQTGGYMGIGFAVPINMARNIAEQLITKGKVTRAWLGVGLVDATRKQLDQQQLPLNSQAALVKNVKPGSPAEQAGLRENDLIIALDNIPITGAADIRNRVSLSSPRSAMIIEIYRNGTRMELSATLAELQE